MEGGGREREREREGEGGPVLAAGTRVRVSCGACVLALCIIGQVLIHQMSGKCIKRMCVCVCVCVCFIGESSWWFLV